MSIVGSARCYSTWAPRWAASSITPVTVNGRIILFLVVDWEAPPTRHRASLNVRICMLICTFLSPWGRISELFFFVCVRASVSPHQELEQPTCTPCHIAHARRIPADTLTPWRLGLPVAPELGYALLDRLFPLRALWLLREHVPIHHCLFSMSLWVQHSFADRPHRKRLLC